MRYRTKNIIIIYISAILALIITSCTQVKESASDKDVSKIDYSDYVHIKPRDSLSTEELELFHKLEKAIYENMSVANNKFSFTLDKDSFINMGIPEKYWTLLMKNIEDNNHFVEREQSIELNLDSSWQENVKAYKNQQLAISV